MNLKALVFSIIITLLIDDTIKTNQGKSALAFAKESEVEECIQLLERRCNQ